MEKGKRLVLPGEFIASMEEEIPGQNTYTEKDGIFASGFGEADSHDHVVNVKWDKSRHVAQFKPGMDVLCVVRKVSPTKAFLNCTPADDIGRPGSGIDTSAVLPVQNMDTSYVRDARDMVRAGDIVRARICKIEKSDVDLQIVDPELGVLKAFCISCRHEMALKKGSLICTDCGNKEQRKISDDYPSANEEEKEE